LANLTATRGQIIEENLHESRARLENGIRALNGNITFYAGIDRSNNAMHNVSFWETVADANQMATFEPMLALATEFVALGVRFDRPILNCNTLWQLDGAAV
jgi:hypothetical protein